MPRKSDATPAYRGYRLQALYTLWRLLKPVGGCDTALVFEPEGQEDLAVYDPEGRLLEVIQVKAHSAPLTLSMLTSGAGTERQNLFSRAAPLLDNEHFRLKIATYGEVGPELKQAIDGDESACARVIGKLAEIPYISTKVAEALLQRTEIESVSDIIITNELREILSDCLAGVDPDSAFDLLTLWLYRCAEDVVRITRTDLIERINAVGRFFAERVAYHENWFTVIEPLNAVEPNEQERQELADQFFRGIATQYRHVVAGLDVRRDHQLEEIADKLRRHRAIIIHGASGQGKSTLAYRYLHDYCPEQWRFQVKHIEDKPHALNIARALTGHAHAMGVPLVIYYDVKPNETAWVELIRELVGDTLVQLLVTIREDDFARTSLPKTDFDWDQMMLSLSREEAECIYEGVAREHQPSCFLSFDDAWSRFNGDWPLLEFIHLLTQGESLRDRLSTQVTRLQDEVRQGLMRQEELSLLRYVAVASEYEACLLSRPICESLKLFSPARTIERLEHEYLLQQSTDGTLISGLHPIRSSILATLLTDAFTPWGETAANCLQFIHTQDIETFLLYSFSRHKDEEQLLLQAISRYRPASWSGIVSVVRALLWRGLRDYAHANADVIADAFREVGLGWLLVLNYDVAGVTTRASEDLLEVFFKHIPEGGKEKIRSLRSRLTDRQMIREYAHNWLTQWDTPLEAPTSEPEWRALAETLFWLGYLNVQWPMAVWWRSTDLEQAMASLPLLTVADLVIGVFTAHAGASQEWIESYRPMLIERFRRETMTVTLEDDGRKVTAHFIVDHRYLVAETTNSPQYAPQSRDIFHEEARKRFTLLRYLFPDREEYGCQGYGHRALPGGLELPHDSTTKTGIPRDGIPLRWLPELNSTFRGLAEIEHRVGTWQEYADIIMSLRQHYLASLITVANAVESWVDGTGRGNAILGHTVDTADWDCFRDVVREPPLLPKTAVDEWGRVDEFREPSEDCTGTESDLREKRYSLVEKAYRPYKSAFNEMTRALSNYADQAVTTLALCPIIARAGKKPQERDVVIQNAREVGMNPDFIRLSRTNLTDALRALPSFQREFRRLLGQFCSLRQLDEFDAEELFIAKRLWPLWYSLTTRPRLVVTDASNRCLARVESALDTIKESVCVTPRGELGNKVSIRIVSDDTLWEGEPALWVTIDSREAIDSHLGFQYVIESVKRVLHTGSDPQLRQEAACLKWPHIIIIPLLCGRSLMPIGWCLHTRSIVQAAKDNLLTDWQLVMQLIPEDSLREADIAVWECGIIELPQRFLQLATQLTYLVGHASDLAQFPETDELGLQVAQTYADGLFVRITDTLQGLFDIGTEIIEAYNSLPTEERINSYLLDIANIIAELKPETSEHPNTEPFSIQLAECAAWFIQLSELLQYAVAGYYLWASDIIRKRLGK